MKITKKKKSKNKNPRNKLWKKKKKIRDKMKIILKITIIKTNKVISVMMKLKTMFLTRKKRST